VFFMGEYAAMFMLSGVFAAVFLGGYNLLPVNWEALATSPPSWLSGATGFFRSMAWFNYWAGPLVFIGKCAGGITFFIWLRATLPRLRYDQLMNLGWKTMLPLGVANFLVVALWIIATRVWGIGGGWVAWAAAAGVLLVGYLNIAALARKSDLAFGARKVKLADPAPARSVRLVDPKKV